MCIRMRGGGGDKSAKHYAASGEGLEQLKAFVP